MIVLGADTHKRSPTVAVVAAGTGELLGEQTVAVGCRGFDALSQCARRLDGDRVWALEDCRSRRRAVSNKWATRDRPAARRAEQTMRVRIARARCAGCA